MELQLDENRQEQKLHGTYGFPVYVSRKRLSSYATGSFPWHWHDEVELTLVMDGGMEYRVNDKRYQLSAGQGLFCNTEALHAGGMASFPDCDYLSVTFHPRLLQGFPGSAVGARYVEGILKSAALSSVVLTGASPWEREALQDIRQVYEQWQGHRVLYELEIQRLLLGLWGRLFENCAGALDGEAPESPERLQRLREILSYLHGHYQEKITLEAAARQAGLCKSQCCRFFKAQMGVSLFDYLLDYRVGKALALLKEGRTVAEAARSAGFSSPAYFAKVMRSRVGRSPSQYRRECREGSLSTPMEGKPC